jgi:Uma2 family endonuclease
MGTTISKPPPLESEDTGVQPRRWTRKEYYRAADLGLFRPNERLELLDGEILKKMSPQKPPHASGTQRTARALEGAFGPGYEVRRQLPLVLGNRSEPEPDLAVVPKLPDDYGAGHPTATDARLVVEVSDTTLRLDRTKKLPAYARAGIPEYWIRNLPARRLEGYRDPAGARYRSITFYSDQEEVTLLTAPQSSIHVGNLLPPLPAPADDANGA